MLKKILLLAIMTMLPFVASAEDKQLLEDVIEEVNPAVVSVISELKNKEKALGAGIIIEADGYVVTNAHVTEDFQKIYVITSEGKQYDAVLVGSDEKTDIALLKIENPIDLEPAYFADSNAVRVGNTVFAIGNPFGLGNSVSLGIISAKERDIEKGPYDNFLQTDATINQGNSGGPLFNDRGKIVGMNTAIFSEKGQYAGIGFATPSNTVKWVAEQIKKNGKVVRGWLGFGVQRIRTKNDDGKYVLIVDNLKENSPAEKSGLKVGDIIVEFGEIPLDNPRIFSLEVSKLSEKTQIPVTISRDEKKIDLVMEVEIMPDKELMISDQELGLETEKEAEEKIKNYEKLGIDTNQLSAVEDFEEIGIKAYFEEKNRELVIIEVKPQSEAFTKELRTGDRIIGVNDSKPFGIEDFKVKIKNAQKTGVITFTILSGTDVYTVNLKVGTKNEQS